MLKRLLSFILVSFFALACRESHVEEVKNFRIFVETDTPALKYSVQILVADYNRHVGFTALSVVDKKEDSTSTIHFQKDLADDGRKLGLGQWTALQKQTVAGQFNQTETMTIEYGMELIFDLDNFLEKAAYIQDPESEGYQHLFHLFCHEVGHGMQMDHTHTEGSVMFPSISIHGSDAVDFDDYFRSVRAFLDDPTSMVSAQQGHGTGHRHRQL
ncbi:matrixin family metalloprotease [Oligoflexus tunisiensis]|uniref:matrixin family metalloprotease n=1 Tax=Oligoflexus tunisiensis TaxID=708132 RepID=UPI00114D0DF5|nr:matrixin family metalloprotease [Oligoflexus tunisiensis]